MKIRQTLKKFQIITATSKTSGEPVYCAIDSHSGGYPYWANCIDTAEHYNEDEAKRIMADFKILGHHNVVAGSIAIATVELMVTALMPVSTRQMEIDEAQKVVDKLEQELTEARAKLQSI